MDKDHPVETNIMLQLHPLTSLVYLDDNAHNRQREDSSRMRRRPAVNVVTSCHKQR